METNVQQPVDPYAPPRADVQTPAPAYADDGLASRKRRFAGLLIDTIPLSALNVFWLNYSGQWETMMSGVYPDIGLQLANLLVWLIMFCAINGVLLARRGQTLGKLVLGMRIVRVRDQQIPDFWPLLLRRYVVLWLPAYIPVVGQGLAVLTGLANMLMIFRSDRRCLHDHVAGTRVIRVTR